MTSIFCVFTRIFTGEGTSCAKTIGLVQPTLLSKYIIRQATPTEKKIKKNKPAAFPLYFPPTTKLKKIKIAERTNCSCCSKQINPLNAGDDKILRMLKNNHSINHINYFKSIKKDKARRCQKMKSRGLCTKETSYWLAAW